MDRDTNQDTNQDWSGEELVRHARFARSVASAILLDPDEVEDVTQDAFVIALEHPPQAPERASGWLAGVARNLARMRLRSAARRAARERLAHRHGEAPSPEETAIRLETQARLVAAVRALSEPYRTTALLRYFDELTPQEISTRMEVPVKTVYTRIHRALDHLRERLTADSPRKDNTIAGLVLLVGEAFILSSKSKIAAAAAVFVLAALCGTVLITSGGPPAGPPSNAVGAQDLARLQDEVARLTRELDRLRLENESRRSQLSTREAARDSARLGAGVGAAGGDESRPFHVADDGTEDPVRIAGDSMDQNKGTIRVFVTGRNGEPMPDADVRMVRPTRNGEMAKEEVKSTDSSGWAEYDGLDPGRFRVSAKIPTKDGAEGDLDGVRYRSVSCQVLRGRITEVSLPYVTVGTAVTGRVVDDEGKVYRRVLVTLFSTETFFTDSYNARTDDQGRFRIEGVSAGRYDMQARGRGIPYSPVPQTVITTSGEGTLEMDLIVGE